MHTAERRMKTPHYPDIFTIKYALLILFVIFVSFINYSTACQFYPVGEYLKFVRIPENQSLGAEVLSLEVHPRSHLTIMPVDKDEDARYFAYKDINATHVSVILAQSLEDLVDSDVPRNLLKFRFVCDYSDGVNFLVRTTIFREIYAIDGDKPNTPNSDVHYAIVKGNEDGKFSLESSQRTALIVRKSLDYDTGDRQFSLVIAATDRGTPVKSSNTTVIVNVRDNDDLGPKFTQDIYRGRVHESYPLQRGLIHKEILLDVPIHAHDQDRDINTPIKYTIVSGNERGLFKIDSKNGTLFLERSIDLDAENSLQNNSFILQIHATQIDNPLKYSIARIHIEILDLNDNLPEFEVDFYNISIVENLPNGFSVLQVVAHDKDQGENSEFNYQLNDPTGAFAVDSNSGWLTVNDERILDREQRSSIRMKVIAVEKTPSVISSFNNISSVEVEITLLDANDNNPIFIPTNIYEFVTETNAKIGSILGQVQAIDNDLGKNGMVKYGLQQTGNITLEHVPFAVDPRTGIVTVTESPIIVGRHAIFVEATDQPANPSEKRFSLAVVTVDVFQPDDNAKLMPDFVGSPYQFWVGANVAVGTSVGQIRINEAAEKRNDILYDLLHSYHEGVPFAVEEQTGTITVIAEIEKYQRRSYEFEGVVTNDKDLTIVTNVSIHVVDPNDKLDIFTKGTTRAPMVFHAKENIPGAFIGQVLPRNGTNTTRNVRFLIANQRDVSDIAITEDGDLYTVRGLDREMRQNYSITVIAETTRGLGIFQVTIVVDDVNDNPPIFDAESYEGHLAENSLTGTEVKLNKKISIYDADDTTNKNFSLTLEGEGNELFIVDSHTGRIFFIGKGHRALDREEKSVYTLRIIASDQINSKSNASLIITIDDINDNAPTFVQMIVSPDYGIVVSKDENDRKILKDNDDRSPVLFVPENVTIGTVIIRLLAEDKDTLDNAKITYSIVNETIYSPYLKSSSDSRPYFIVNSRSGALSIARSLPVGRKIHLDVIASDRDNLTDHVMVKMNIVDVNDHSPVFKKSWYSFDVAEGVYTHYKIGKIIADDMDMNNNGLVNYKVNYPPLLLKSSSNVTIEIEKDTGILSITGNLDRETQNIYKIIITAYDNGIVPLSSTVNVEINVLDINDNSPEFYGFVDEQYVNDTLLPIYYASVGEDVPIGTIVHRVYANDSDFIGNGNGLILFNLPQTLGEKQYFTIDNKDGVISTVDKLDYESQEFYNITIIASDLGSPSLTSTAMLFLRILDIDEPHENIDDKPVFQHRYYEVEVEENSIAPIKLLQLNVSDAYVGQTMRYEIVSNNSEILDLFRINTENGMLMLMKSVDREYNDHYEFKVKVDRIKVGRGITTMIYPIDAKRLGGLGINEAKIVVRVKDINDNAPRFKSKGRPFLAAIPASINYGHKIIEVEAFDPDEGINGEVRYQILGRENDQRFAIDPLSGQVRAVGSFARDAGRVFGFDVKATDCRDSENGRSSIANVFVYVVDDNKQVVMVMGRKPTEIEDQVDDIARALKNVTGLDVRVRKLEPHIEKNLIDTTSTDVYLYAVDPDLNIMVDMDSLHNVFRKKKSQIKGELERYRVLEIAGSTPRRSSQRYLLSTLEVGVVVLGCVVFVGALVTVLCVVCVRRNKRRGRSGKLGTSAMSMYPPVGFALAEPTTTLGKPTLFPTYVDGLHYDPESFAAETRRLSICDHEPGCIHHHHHRKELLWLKIDLISPRGNYSG
ncbi:hypothetical protein PV327_009943 [Microctonus hyperodae]|uniref:Cadherin domain-containing protein n=2 Tax=Microctonus hyperodae TaxID=165561 RepID=A0AA39F212_MICHY|nr:hypothetical protein PV327_009943 [Microctonus hyperodae]